ncbi:hypothetical protein KCP73_06110 [Salmonella enterica subsp. enterica]|nr:hypothetical protein KCP73_06110 [Salmonella enterica subsp. enterica]
MVAIWCASASFCWRASECYSDCSRPPAISLLTDTPDALSSLAKARVFIDRRRLSITFARLYSSLNSG